MKASYIKNSLLRSINFMNDNLSAFVKHPGVDFTRNRKCPFQLLILSILSMETHSLNREIRRSFQAFDLPVPSKSAFIQQRNKLNDKVFPNLFTSLNDTFSFRKTYRGYHLLAVDGSDINIPPLKEDTDTFVASNTPDVGYYQMHLNALYDVLEERYAGILVQPRAQIDEREAFISLLHDNPVKGKRIYLADRGYFSFNVLAHLLKSEHFFVLRINSPDARSSFLKRFSLPAEGEFDTLLDFNITRSKKSCYSAHPDRFLYIRPDRTFDFIPVGDHSSLYPINVRILRIRLKDGSYEYLLTNLSATSFSPDVLKHLYQLRWGIETSFRFLKYNIALNNFHSIRRDFIIQEMFARVILYNLTMLLVHSVSPPHKECKYQYKVSVSDAITTCRDFLINRVKNAEIKDLLLHYLTAVRPGRSFPRKPRSKRFVPLTNRA